jgi:hypothetical protein
LYKTQDIDIDSADDKAWSLPAKHNLSRLQQTNQLKRIGSDKTGYWEVQP